MTSPTPPRGATRTLTIGTRGSRLARRQVELVEGALRAVHPEIDLKVREIKTEGDTSTAPLSQIGGQGVFTKAIEDALLARDIDIAVHSLKDLPADLPDGLTLGAIPQRADPRDALVTRSGVRLHDLRPGARIGTGSARRAVQLLELRRDLKPCDIRGNVDTRVRKVFDGEYDGAVLAMAGLERLELTSAATGTFSIDEMLPAVGQGALAVECRGDDAEAIEFLRTIDDTDSRIAVEAERAFLRRLGAGCRLPVGAFGRVERGELYLKGMIAFDSGEILRHEVRGASREARSLGERLADVLLASGPVKSLDG